MLNCWKRKTGIYLLSISSLSDQLISGQFLGFIQKNDFDLEKPYNFSMQICLDTESSELFEWPSLDFFKGQKCLLGVCDIPIFLS